MTYGQQQPTTNLFVTRIAGLESTALYLRETPIDKQFRSGDVACVVGGKKHDGLRDLIGCAEPAKGNIARDHLQALLARF